MTEPAAKTETQGFGLPQILNILWRGRRIVIICTLLGVVAGIAYGIITKPLYRSVAQVRPGIVSYTIDGIPVRETALKDVVLWYRSFLYWDDLRVVAPYDEYQGPPIILAEFIAPGPQFQRGGDIVTLSNLSTDPLVAVDILERSIASFNAHAAADSNHGTLALTRGGLDVRMDKVRADIAQVQGEKDKLDLAIQDLDTQIRILDADAARLDERMDRLEYGRKWRLEAVSKTAGEVDAARQRLADANGLLKQVPGGDSARAGELMASIADLGRYLYHTAARADSLQDAARNITAEIASLTLQRDVDIQQKKLALETQKGDLAIQRDVDMGTVLAGLEADLQALVIQDRSLTPLEQVGPVAVSTKPVRPRKLRAAAILTMLAFMGSLFLVFAWEYFRMNRRDILAGPPER